MWASIYPPNFGCLAEHGHSSQRDHRVAGDEGHGSVLLDRARRWHKVQLLLRVRPAGGSNFSFRLGRRRQAWRVVA
jgi:hypothetical protein